MENKGEFVVYRQDEITSLEVRVENENVWLNRRQLSVLFDRDVKTISSSCRKICDNWKIFQFLAQCICNVFADGLYISIK